MQGRIAVSEAAEVAHGRAARRPNVIVLFDDQLRAAACSLYGGRNITTPNIDRLATQGVTFSNATSICPLCTPFRGMSHMGRYPTHTGLVPNWVEANPRQRDIAHVFHDAGYHTGFIGKWHLAAGRRKKAGYHYRNPNERERAEKASLGTLKTPRPSTFLRDRPGSVTTTGRHTTSMAVRGLLVL